MNLKRILVLIMLASLVTCTACSKKTGNEKNKTENQPTESIDEKSGDGEQEGNPEVIIGGANSKTEVVIGGEDSEEEDNSSKVSTLEGSELEKKESMEAYEGFLNNEVTVHFDRFMHCDYYDKEKALFESENGYTLSEVLNKVTAYYYKNTENTKINSIDYNYIDCGKDGVNELALRFNGMDIYSPEDDSTLVYIMKYIDGKLALCYCYETWARSESTLNEYGYYESWGSSGATSHGGDYGVIDKDGNWKFIVSIESELDINQLSWSDELGKIPTVAETKGISGGIELDTVQFESAEMMENLDEVGDIESFYTFYHYDEEIGLIEDADLYTNSVYKDIFDEAGVPFITPDEVDAMIAGKEEKIGVTEEIKAGVEITWKELNGNLFSDYVGR